MQATANRKKIIINKTIDKVIFILKYVVMLLLILKTQSVFTFFKDIDLHINLILSINLMLLTILRIYNKEIIICGRKNQLEIIALYMIYIVLYALMTRGEDKSYIANYVVILPLFFINLADSKDIKEEIVNASKIFTKLILIITILSIFFYVFGSLLNIIKPTNNVTIEWGVERNFDSYFLLHYNAQNINVGNVHFYRNSSIFTEAPMFSLVLSVALMFEVFINDAKRKNYIAIFVLGLISTVTLSAFISIFLIYILWLFINVKSIYKNRKLLVLNIIIMLITLAGVSILLNIRSNTSSLNIRSDDYAACFKAFSKKIFLGNGYNNEDAIKEYMSDFRWYNQGLSNSIGTILAEGGIYFSILYILPCVILLRYSIIERKKNLFSLMICYVVSISIFIYHTTPLMFFILSMMYAYIYDYTIEEVKEKEANEKINN